MSQYIERFENHPIHENMDQAEVLITEAESQNPENVDAIEKLSRIKQVHSYSIHLLSSCDPNIVSNKTLNNLNSHLDNLNNYLQNYNNSGNLNILDNAVDRVEQMLVYISQLNIPQSTTEIEGLQDSTITFKRSLSQHARYLEEKYEDIDQKIKSISNKAGSIQKDLDKQKERVDNIISDYQDQFSKAEDRRRQEAQEAAQERENEFQSRLEEYKQQISKAEEELEETVDTFTQDAQEEIDKLHHDTLAEAESLISELEQQKSEAESIVGIISDTATTGRYQEIADKEQIAMRVFQAIAVISMGALIWFGYTVFSATAAGLSGAGFSWPMFAAKVFATATIGVLAAYSARQADKHQSVLRRNRKMELELRAIGPYLDDLPEDDQREVKKKLADRLFGNELKEQNDADSFSGTPRESLKFLAESILKLVSKD